MVTRLLVLVFVAAWSMAASSVHAQNTREPRRPVVMSPQPTVKMLQPPATTPKKRTTPAVKAPPPPLTYAPAVSGNPLPFGIWLDEVKREAIGRGIRPETITAAFAGISPNSRVVELDRKQPEGTVTFSKYVENTVAPLRVQQGQKLLAEHDALLRRISQQYGVPSRIILALWGKESNYGANTGGFSVIEALATLAYDGRRSAFFREELLKALQILDAEHMKPADMKGSWAGAMGQCQFMPSSFLTFAADGDGDGKHDIWTNKADVFASIANYLRESGWNPDTGWGHAVRLSAGMPAADSDFLPMNVWRSNGVTLASGAPLPEGQAQAKLIFPGKPEEGAYLVYPNYDVIMKWNRSRYFATAVGLLSNRIKGIAE